jgi:hypothetical protein
MKNHGERIAALEAAYVQSGEHYQRIEDHLVTLNGAVAENSKFRVQGNATLKTIGIAWVSVLIPLTVIAVAVLK